MLIIGVIFIFAAIVFLVMGLTAQGAENPMTARLAGVRGERTYSDYSNVVEKLSIGTRVFSPLANSMSSKLEGLMPTNWLEGIDRRLVQAGQPTTRTGFLIGMIVTEGVVSAFGLTLAASAGLSGRSLLFVGASLIMGLYMPKIWLDNRMRHRQKEILKSLPDAFDLITTCVEAGLGLEAAIAKVAEKVQGPFGEELAVTLREVSLGKLRRDALRELADRTGVPDLTSFINAVIQAETMGTSIATVLRVQAEQMRTKRRQRAEQQAHAAPIKMMFPLVLCIFPSLFIVILGPACITIYKQLVQQGG